MSNSVRQKLNGMELEEKILNSAAIMGICSVFMPWLSGEWLGGTMENFSGLEFFHAYIGMGFFIINIVILFFSLLPFFNVKLPWTLRKRAHIRLILSIMSTTLAFSALSVLARLTFDSARMDIRFGAYIALVGGMVTTLYSWLRLQEIIQNEPLEHFGHPEDSNQYPTHPMNGTVFVPHAPPPPPPPMPPEEHRMHR